MAFSLHTPSRTQPRLLSRAQIRTPSPLTLTISDARLYLKSKSDHGTFVFNPLMVFTITFRLLSIIWFLSTFPTQLLPYCIPVTPHFSSYPNYRTIEGFEVRALERDCLSSNLGSTTPKCTALGKNHCLSMPHGPQLYKGSHKSPLHRVVRTK